MVGTVAKFRPYAEPWRGSLPAPTVAARWEGRNGTASLSHFLRKRNQNFEVKYFCS